MCAWFTSFPSPSMELWILLDLSESDRSHNDRNMRSDAAVNEASDSDKGALDRSGPS